MKRITLSALGATLLLAGCGAPAEKSIEKDCVRLEMTKEMAGADEQKKTCACLAGKLKEDMSEKNLKALAKALKASKGENDFEAKSKENGLDESDVMVMMGAAKSCATAS